MKKAKKSLLESHPELSKQWHPTKNSNLTPNDVTAGSNKKAWWKCPKGNDHEWEASIDKRTNGHGCPICKGQKVVNSNCLATKYPELAKEWHFTKNGNLTPNNVAARSSKKVWWKCSENSKHEWQAIIGNRTRQGGGCPFCTHQKVTTDTCLAITHSYLLSNWHPIKNGALTPYNIFAGSNRKVWWKCSNGKDHEWQASIVSVVNSKSRNRGCPFCRGLKVSMSNSFAINYPKLSKQWHSIKNGKLSPSDVIAGSHKRVWWKCPKGDDHEWETTVKDRTSGDNCPFCSGHRVSITNCLATINNDLSKQWHPTRNGKLTPNDITAGSNRKVWWRCDVDPKHEWEAIISSRSRGAGCPFCSNHKVNETNCLAVRFPNIAKEWHPIKNKNITPFDVVAGGKRVVWWQCLKDSEHQWRVSIGKRVKGSKCPFCANRNVSKSNCLAATDPKLAKEWHLTKNKNVTPYNIAFGSHKKVWWKCSKGEDHEWEATVVDRANGRGCPVCAGRKLTKSNCLLTLHPKLAKEWHPLKNGNLKSEDVYAGGHKKFWWKCLKNSNHEWRASIGKRIAGRDCPFCNSGWTIDNIRHFVKSIKDNINFLTPSELYILFQQNGLLNTYSKAKPFIEALKTGKFPKEELNKFCNQEPSLVDDLINDKSVGLEDHLSEADIISKHEISDTELEKNAKEKELPMVEAKDVLATLDNKIFSNADEETVEFFIVSGCAKIWKHAFVNEKQAVSQAQDSKGGKYPTEVKKRFLEEYNGSKYLHIPSGYQFEIENKLVEPNLMQKLSAYKIKKYKRQGNWSGTGAGKTLSAILASRVIDSKLTIICCPNSVVRGWANNIQASYPDSIVHEKNLIPNINQSDNKHHYIVLNYEAFQQENSEAMVKKLVDKYKIDFIVVDEIHQSKQRVVEDMSKRKKVITGLITHAGAKNPDVHVFGMSATPVINNLYEGVSLLEMITSVKYDDLNTTPTVNNCMSLYQKLTTIGIRWLPKYEQKLNINKISVDCDDYVEEIKELGIKNTMLDLEKILTKARLPIIKQHIKPKTLIYTHYIEDICYTLKEEIQKDGWKVAFFTGEDKSGLDSFINSDTDVLIASSAIATGVDGLQAVCNRLIVNILPWTHAEFEQLKGRIYRQGQKEKEVDVIVPLTFAEISGNRWSWCESKWKRIQFKKSIADASVDGIVPEGHLRSPAQAYTDAMNWLKRLEEGKIHKIERYKIHIPLSEVVIQRQIRKYGDFSLMNRRINNSNSQTTNKRFQNDPKEWEQYHALYRESRKEWPIIPYEEMITWCKARPHLIIGDFGCGEAKIAEALDNTVYSFDHVAINKDVIACDISHVPLENAGIDVAIFSLSLMGTNFIDYIKEAHRCLKLDGYLHIIEATSRFTDIKRFTLGLEKVGFDIVKVEEKYKFTFIRAIKSERNIKEVELNF